VNFFLCRGKNEKRVNLTIILKIVKTGNVDSEITELGIESSDQDVLGEV
jgi:hypothetical protein